MRVTDSYRFQSFQSSIATSKERMNKIEEMISSSRKILTPSDDPVGTAEYMQLQTQNNTNIQYLKNLQRLTTLGGYYETTANTVKGVLNTAKQLATTMASDTQNATTRKDAATNVEGLIEQLVTAGNTKVGNTYIFGGKKSNTAAFTLNADYSVTFNGSSDVLKVQTSSGQTEKMGISGQTFFGTAIGSTDNMFAALKDLKDALESNSTTGISGSLDKIGNAVDLAANNISYVGTYINKVSSLTDTLTNNNINLQTVMSDIMDVDTIQAYSDYTTLNNIYEASLTVLTKMQKMNILNYI
ncbi:MAG: flagellar hook-associated protein 3 [Syntrophus sp. (in: bacteria)]|nr:flagellar hook-associated protein 3 [Syntrophus sp. (in: bacteria)]